MPQVEQTPEEVAALRVMNGLHVFAAECLVMFGEDTQIGLAVRRMAQRAIYQLIYGLDPDLEEIRQHVAEVIQARRDRLAALTAR